MKILHLYPLLLISTWFLSCAKNRESLSADSGYTDRSKCLACHEQQYELHAGSHHDLAMEKATDKSVLGDFDNSTIVHLGDSARFYRKGDRYFVYTAGDKGEYKEFEIEYTFGWTPLQQYLVKFPRGYYQVLPFCWDSRPAEAGGQRWFHIYDQEKIPYHDFLYWTKPQQNWNHVCAECHSTRLRKNFTLSDQSFSTSWSEIDVSCDACHGPSANHLKWAELESKGMDTDEYPHMGYAFTFPNDSSRWVFNEEKGTAYRSGWRKEHTEIELCARCHSRRMQVWEDYKQGEALTQTHLPSVLEPQLYYPDGQIREEVYVYGSFLQSKMYRQGVTCSDCHDPHSMQVKAPGNQLCMQCHSGTMYNTAQHHFHDPVEAGGSCLDCHMPETRYMVIDPRRDHSMRIPRPDLSLRIGSPNACTQCHTDKNDSWADSWFRKWYGNKYDTIPHYGEVFYAAGNGDPAALDKLISVSTDTSYNDIVRASAVHYMLEMPSMKSVKHIQRMSRDKSPLVRIVALRSLNRLVGNQAIDQALEGLSDPVRAVRYEAGNIYIGVPYIEKADRVSSRERKALDEYIAMLKVNNDQAATHTNLGIYYQNEDKPDSALLAFKTALRLDSASIEAAIDIADIYRIYKRDPEGEKLLLEMLGKNPDRHELYLALGLLYTRLGEAQKSILMLEQAHRLSPENTYYCYVYGIALNSQGHTQEALDVLLEGYNIDPYNYNILYSLAGIYRDTGDMRNFRFYYDELMKLQQTLN